MIMSEVGKVALQILVDPEVAARLEKQGLAELVLRLKNKRFEEFVKCAIAKCEDQKAAKQVAQAALGKAGNVLNAAPYAGIAMQAIGIAASIAGIIIISEKINKLSGEVAEMKSRLDQIKDISIETDILQVSEKLTLEFNQIVDKLRNGEPISTEFLENYLISFKPFMTTLINLLRNRDVDAGQLLNIIFTLLPAYTSVLSIYLKSYYFSNHSKPANYEKFMEVFKDTQSDAFNVAVQDYYFLNKKYPFRDVISILDAQHSFLIDGSLEIEDQMALLDAFDDEETYRLFEKQLEQAVEKEVEASIADISEKSGVPIEKCREVLLATA